jgi:hypothetical protein
MYMRQFSKRPTLRPVSHAKRHSFEIDRPHTDVLFGRGTSHELDFTLVGSRKRRRSLLTPLRRMYHFLAGKRRSIF